MSTAARRLGRPRRRGAPARAHRAGARAVAAGHAPRRADQHLDIHHQIEILRLIRDLDLTSVVALHDLNLAAMLCDRIVVLLAGAVVASGSPASVLTEALLREVFRIEAGVSASPYQGRPHIHLMAG